MKKQMLLASILTSSLAMSTLAAHAEIDQVVNAKARLKEFETKHGTKNKDYYLMLASLAQAYQYAGKRKEAKEYFEKSLALLDQQENGKRIAAYQKSSWANTLLFGSQNVSKEDREEAIALLHGHENYLDSKKADPQDYLNIAATYYRAKEWSELKTLESKISTKLDEAANNTESKGKIYHITNGFFMLGSMHVEKKNRQYIGIASSPEELEKATTYFQKAIALCERLPEKDGYAIDIYRHIAQFYKANGKTELAAKYTKVLAKALGSSEPAVLFPPFDPCPACGRG
jgi:tetratricopeptide (TPR) repeat protein